MLKKKFRRLRDEEIVKLLKIAEESKGKNLTLYRKARVVLLRDQGKTIDEVADEVGITKQNVLYILKQFEKDGVDGLIMKKRGRKKKFNDEDRDKIINLVENFAPFEFRIEKNYWTLNTIVKALRKIYNVKISPNTVRKILIECGIDLKSQRDKFKKQRLIDHLKS